MCGWWRKNGLNSTAFNRMTMTTLRSYADLGRGDFDAHPLWICAYGIDQEQPWYAAVDEVTYRPWHYDDPRADSPQFAATHLLAKAVFELVDGTRAGGFATPRLSGASEAGPSELGFAQPSLFLPDGDKISFWVGSSSIPGFKERLQKSFGEGGSAIFPIRYWFDCELPTPAQGGVIPGFAAISPDGRTIMVER